MRWASRVAAAAASVLVFAQNADAMAQVGSAARGLFPLWRSVQHSHDRACILGRWIRSPIQRFESGWPRPEASRDGCSY
jgi:hypothetical protein